VVLAGDTSPIDVYSHMPVACEEADVPYCFVPSREVGNTHACRCLISAHLLGQIVPRIKNKRKKRTTIEP